MQKQEWVSLFIDNQAALRRLVEKFHPSAMVAVVVAGGEVDVLAAAAQSKDQYPITAGGAEAVCARIRSEIQEENSESPVLRFDAAASNADIDGLVDLLNDTWFGMPESTAVREEPGFQVLCELCEGVDEEGEIEEVSAEEIEARSKRFKEVRGHSPEEFLRLYRSGEIPPTLNNTLSFSDALFLAGSDDQTDAEELAAAARKAIANPHPDGK